MDDTYYYSHESRLLVIVVSLLLHLLLLILIFMFQTIGPLSEAEQRALSPQLQDITTVFSQAPTQAANVIFQDLPNPADYEYDATTTNTTIPTTVASTQADDEQAPTTAFALDTEETTYSDQSEPAEDSDEPEQTTTDPHSTTQESYTPESGQENYAHSWQDISIKTSHMQQKTQEYSAPKPRKKTTRKNKNPYARPAARKAAAASLGKITSGFMQSMQQEQGTLPRVQQDISTLKQHMFNTKIWSLLRQTINAQRELVHLQHNVNEDVMVIITIGKRGNFIDLQMIHEPKTPELAAIEQVLFNAARNAGLYPPIPSTLNTETLTLRFKLNIHGEQGFHTYQLSYQ